SDDPSRYRDEAVTEIWKDQRDPIRRLESYLGRRGWIAAGEHDALAQQIEAEVRDAIARQEAVSPPALETLIDDVYEPPTRLLRGQLAELTASARTRSPHQR